MTHLFKIAFAMATPAALLFGQPPQIPGATGDQQRHYYFQEAGKEIPYRLYVPSRFDGKTKLPMMVCLHGAGGTQDTLMDWGHGMLKDLAEKHGYIVVTPLGYAPGGSYGQHYDIGIPMEARAGGNVNEAERIYLMGHSRGALATWYLGNKYRQLWAGLAPVAGGFLDTDYPFGHLRGIPVIVSQGSADTLALPERARKQVAAIEKIGLHPRYVEVAGATHGSIVDAAFSGIFDFFDESRGK